jgi:hypothetical protein
MSERFDYVGYVKKVREGDRHIVANVPGKVALVISDMHAGDMLGYFPQDRRPKTGVRIGATGTWVQVEVPLSALDSEELADLCAGGDTPTGTPLQSQLDVNGWSRVSEAYDPLFD